MGRDPSRTPMQWDGTGNAGFSAAKPWLPLEVDYTSRNVAQQQKDPHSILSLYHQLIELRRKYPALSSGAARVISADNDVLMYERALPEERIAVVLNFGPDTQELPPLGQARLLLSTETDRTETRSGGQIQGNEGLILLLAQPAKIHSA